jgi:hypothetical protein
MCRSIKSLRRPDELSDDVEIREASLQFVRKVSGYRKPSKTNEEVFEQAIVEIGEATRKLMDGLKNRAVAK